MTIKLKCKRCGKEWDYKGEKRPNDSFNRWTTCPNCLTSVKIKEFETNASNICSQIDGLVENYTEVVYRPYNNEGKKDYLIIQFAGYGGKLNELRRLLNFGGNIILCTEYTSTWYNNIDQHIKSLKILD